MTKTGIKKYDSLPARIGRIDVDCLRYDYDLNNREIAIITKDLKKIKERLDKAVKQNKKR